MVEVGTIITIAISVIIIGIIGFFIYKRRFRGRAVMRRGPGRYQRTTREGEPLEDYRGEGGGLISRSSVRIVIPVIIGVIMLVVVLSASVKIVDAGHRGVLLKFGAVDTSTSLNEGIHFVTPFRDNIVQLEVRTQKTIENAASASRDLQDVSTQVAVNYHINPATAQILFQQLGFDYASRVIAPAIQESVKQVTARFNAENLITNRETVKSEIEQQIKQRLAAYNIDVEALSITEFQFSEQFRRAVEAKVEAEQRALQANNDLRRIEIEAQQAEARAIGEREANIARAEGVRQAAVLQAQGEAEAIQIVEAQLRENPRYLEWLKTQRWDGVLPLVTGGGEGATPFIEIPSGREPDVQGAGAVEQGSNGTATSTPSTAAAAAGNSTQATR
ncbi:MAG: prohibitin family protein [Thermoproteota archaeon]|nr:prohibitin family protein [Thermoproteota archaeon]MDQ3888568.1 prohibitin family protein [Thermoproteota archaeon]